MKLKEFKQTELWKMADCIEYIDKETGTEIETPTTEVKRRQFYNREVVNYSDLLKNGNFTTMQIVLR